MQFFQCRSFGDSGTLVLPCLSLKMSRGGMVYTVWYGRLPNGTDNFVGLGCYSCGDCVSHAFSRSRCSEKCRSKVIGQLDLLT